MHLLSPKKTILWLTLWGMASGAHAEPAPFVTEARHAILTAPASGTVLFSHRADEPTAPSSMTKIMTAYLAFEALRLGTVSLDEKHPVSVRAWKETGTRMFIEPRHRVTTDDLLRGLIAVSGNDAAVALAEGLAGSHDAFVKRMNVKAQELGLSGSHFENPSGLPGKNHHMTAADLAKLSARLIADFPDLYQRYFQIQYYKYNDIRQRNANTLLSEDWGVDGIKTGYTDAGGYGITVSAVQGGMRLIAVVNGLERPRDARRAARTLLKWGFSRYVPADLSPLSQLVLRLPVRGGDSDTVAATIRIPSATRTVGRATTPKVRLEAAKEGLQAPLSEGQVLGWLVIDAGDPAEEWRLPIAAGMPVGAEGAVGGLLRSLTGLWSDPEAEAIAVRTAAEAAATRAVQQVFAATADGGQAPAGAPSS